MPKTRTRSLLCLGAAVLALAAAGAASALVSGGRAAQPTPEAIFPLLAQPPAARDSVAAADATVEPAGRLPFGLAAGRARVAWSGRGYGGQTRRIDLTPSSDGRWVCATLVGDAYRGGDSCSETDKMFATTPYQLSIQSDGGPVRATRIELAGVVSTAIASVVVTDTASALHTIAPSNGTFYYAPSAADLARGIGLARIAFYDDGGREVASRALPPF